MEDPPVEHNKFTERDNLQAAYDALLMEHTRCVEVINNVDKAIEAIATRRDELLKNPADSFNYGRGVGLDEVLFIFGQPSRLFS